MRKRLSQAFFIAWQGRITQATFSLEGTLHCSQKKGHALAGHVTLNAGRHVLFSMVSFESGMPPSCDHTIRAGHHDLSLAAPSTPPDQPGLPLDPSQSHHASFKFQQDT